MQIDWQRGEWQCVRMVVDQLIDHVVELSKELQDTRRRYSEALDKTCSQGDLISRLQQTVRSRNARISVDSIYIETLEHDLIERGVSRGELDSVYEEIERQCDGGDE